MSSRVPTTSFRLFLAGCAAFGAVALTGCASESADTVEDAKGALGGAPPEAARSCDADTDDANLRAAAHEVVAQNAASGHRATNIKVGQVGIGVPGKPRTIYFTATDEQDSIPAGEVIRLNFVGSAVIQPDCSGKVELSQGVVDAATMLTGSTTAGRCGLDTDDDNLRSVAVAFIEKDLFTSSMRVRDTRIGMAGFGQPTENRTIYFSNTLLRAAAGEKHAIAGKLVVAPDCKIVSNENQALED